MWMTKIKWSFFIVISKSGAGCVGFFTGMNVARAVFMGVTADKDVTRGTTHKEWMPWIYSYCRAHPTENLESAALELVKALSSKNP